MSSSLKNWTQKVIKEITQHAENGCPKCRALLTELTTVYGVNPEALIKNKNS